jgi:nifR3 family TIM-barrel protein
MNIGSVTLENPTVFAPLAGITALPMRMMAKEFGCGLVCSEMISANGLVHKSPKTVRMLQSHPGEKPLSVQIFGLDPAMMAEAAAMVEASGADILDVNFGCSVGHVVRTGSGAALMRSPETARRILSEIRRAIRIPLTIKMRTGWDKSGDQALALTRIAEDCGVDAVAVHPRTATQGFRGEADWTLIRRLKEQTRLPVIGNGDIQTPQDALRMRMETGCDAVMIGRAAMGSPWIFGQVNALFQGRQILEPDLSLRQNVMERYIEMAVSCLGEYTGCRILRGRIGWFAAGLPRCSSLRKAAGAISSRQQALELVRDYMEALRQDPEKTGSSDDEACYFDRTELPTLIP